MLKPFSTYKFSSRAETTMTSSVILAGAFDEVLLWLFPAETTAIIPASCAFSIIASKEEL